MRYSIRDSYIMYCSGGIFFLCGAAEFLMLALNAPTTGTLGHRVAYYDMPLVNCAAGLLALLAPGATYYELTRDKLIYRQFWQRRAIPYTEIQHISDTTKTLFSITRPIIRLEYGSGKKFNLVPEARERFLADLIPRVPQAVVD